jgi:hypothetical protein
VRGVEVATLTIDIVRQRVTDLVGQATDLLSTLERVPEEGPEFHEDDTLVVKQVTKADARAALKDVAAYHAGYLDELEKLQAAVAAIAKSVSPEWELMNERERLNDSLMRIRQALGEW